MFNSVSQTEYPELSQNEKPLFRFKNPNWYQIYINSINRIYKWLWYHYWETWNFNAAENKNLITFPKPDPCKSINWLH